MRLDIFAELLKQAVEEPFGLAITTNNPKQMVLRLHEVQRQLRLDLMICTPSLENTVFLVRRSVELDP